MVSALVVGTNTYQSQAAADTVLGDLIHTTAWSFIDADTKALSLITAFTDIEQLNLVDPDTQVAIAPGAAPAAIKQAQAELAFVYSQDPDAANSTSSDGTNVKQVKAGEAQVTFFAPVDGTNFPARVQALITPYLPGSGTSTNGSYTSGACDASSFDTADELLLNKGLS